MASSHSTQMSNSETNAISEKFNNFFEAPMIKDLGEAIAYFENDRLSQNNALPEYFSFILNFAFFHFHINRIEEGVALLDIIRPPLPPELLSSLKEKANPNIKWTYNLSSLQKAIKSGATTLKGLSIKREFIAEFKKTAEAPHSLLAFIKQIRSTKMTFGKAHLCLKLCMEIFYTGPAVLSSTSSIPQNSSSTSSSNPLEVKFEQTCELLPPFQDQAQIDNYFQSNTSTDNLAKELFYLSCFMVKIGEETLGNTLLQQLIIVHPQAAPYSSLRLTKRPTPHEPQRSTVEFTKLLKNTLEQEIPRLHREIDLIKLRPLDTFEEMRFWIDLLIHHCFFGELTPADIGKNISLSQANEIIPTLIKIGKDINSIEFLKSTKELAETRAPHYISEIETVINAHQKQTGINPERSALHIETNHASIVERLQEGRYYVGRITQEMLNNTTNPYNLTLIIQTICELLPKNHFIVFIATSLLKLYLQLLYQSNHALRHLFPIKEEKTEIKVTPKENKLEKMSPLSPQEYSDLANDQLSALTSQDHYSYHLRNMYATAIKCKEILPFNSIQFGLFKNKDWQNSIDILLQAVYQTPLTDSSSILFMLAHFLVGVGKIQEAVWLLQFLQSQTASVVVKSKLDELQAKTTSINLELSKPQAISAALNPKKLESSITTLKKALEHNPAILDQVLPLFKKSPKPIQFLDLLISIVKESHPAIIAFVLREYCFGYSYSNDIRKKAIFVPVLEGPGPRSTPAKKAKAPINEEKKTQLPKENISNPIPQSVAAPSIPIPDTSSTPKKETYSVVRSKTRNTKKIKKNRPDKKKDNTVEVKASIPVQPSTSFQPTDSTAIINQLFKMTSGGHKPKENKLNTSPSSSSHETKKMSSPRVSFNKASHLESSLSDFLPYISPLTIPKIQAFLDNIQKIGATVYVYGSAHDYWLLEKTGNQPTFIPNDFDLKINCGNLSPDQMQRVFIEAKQLIPEILQHKIDKHYDFIEGKMDADHICNITFEKADYIKTQDPIIISDCKSQITSKGVKCDLNAYPELKHNLEQKIFSIRPLTSSSTTTELPAQSVLMRVVKKVHSTCQLSELKPDVNVNRFFSFEGALQFFETIPSKINLELSKLFDWVGKQIASRKKTSADFCKKGIGGLLPFMQAYLVVKNPRNDINAATQLLQHILATENPEKLFQYNPDSRSFPIDDKLRTLMTPQRNYLLPTHAIANTMLR